MLKKELLQFARYDIFAMALHPAVRLPFCLTIGSMSLMYT